MDRFYGKFLGTVVNNADPKKVGRLTAKVPEVLGDKTSGWCMAASPYCGTKSGLAAVPPRGSLVFIEWPGGDVTRPPIWSGGPWAGGDGVPNSGPETFVILTPAGHRFELRDSSGQEAVTVTAKSGARMTMDANGVKAEFNQQTLELTSSGISLSSSPPGSITLTVGTQSIRLDATGINITAATPVVIKGTPAISLNAPALVVPG